MFWARPLEGNGIDSIGLSGVDEEHNVCFFANGREGGSLPINASAAVPLVRFIVAGPRRRASNDASILVFVNDNGSHH